MAAFQLEDVPSGVEAATLGGCILPEYAKSTIKCDKMSWILDDMPRIELDFGKDHKRFKFQVESSNFDLFKSNKEFKFERTGTETIFTIKKTDRNPPSRLNTLEEYTKKYLELLVVDKFEVHFNQFQKFDITDCFIWKITKNFSGIFFNPSHDIVFTADQLRFLLGEVSAEIFVLPKMKCPFVLKPSEHDKPIRHVRVNFHCDFLPFEFFLKMESKRMIAKTDTVKVSDLNKFVKTWIGGKHLQNLKSLVINFSEMPNKLTYAEVLHDVKSDGIHDGKEKVSELNVADLENKKKMEDEGCEIKRKGDAAIATVVLKDDMFCFTVKE